MWFFLTKSFCQLDFPTANNLESIVITFFKYPEHPATWKETKNFNWKIDGILSYDFIQQC